MKWIFTGVVFPERASVNVSPIEMQANLPEFASSVRVKLSIAVSRISCVVETDNDIDLWTLRNVVDQMVATIIDAYGFATGRGYAIEIEAATDPDTGDHVVFGVDIPVLENSVNERPIEFGKMMSLSNLEPLLHRALADLRHAAREPGDSGFFAYRAVETLRHHWPSADDSKSATARQWESLRTELNVSRSVFDFIKTWADSQRHGQEKSITSEERGKILLLAWSVVYRFCILIDESASSRPCNLPLLDL